MMIVKCFYNNKIGGLRRCKTTLFIVFIIGNFSSLSGQDFDEKNLNFVVYPYLQELSDNSMCVMWETSMPAEGQVFMVKSERHILKPELKVVAQEGSQKEMHKLTINNLRQGELYFYQVVNVSKSGDTLKGPVTQILIPDYKQSAISFTVVGDNQGHTECWERINQLMFEESPQFVVHVGDLVSYGHHKDDWTEEFFKQARDLMRHVPLYPAIGNHEMNDEKYYTYFNKPYDNAFYTIKKGDLRLIFVDTNKDILAGSAQYQNLEKTLAQCKEKWKIVIHHHPIFTSDIASYRSSLMATADKGDPNTFQLKNLYETYDVDLVLSGHVHGYERSYPISKNHIDEKNGVVYIISAGGGGRCNQESSYKEWFTLKTKKRMHYLNIQVQGNKMKVEAIDTSRIVFDAWGKEKEQEPNSLTAPLIAITPKYFIDSTHVTIENPNIYGSVNYRLNNDIYKTTFKKTSVITIKNTTTISALTSEVDHESMEAVKTAIKIPLMQKQRAEYKHVKANYYEGYFTTLPDFEQLKPVKTFTLDSLLIDKVTSRSKDHFAVNFKASISIPETAVYRFFLESFDGSSLVIDGQEIIQNDGVHYEIFKEGYAALEEGEHNIEVRYFDFKRRETLNLLIGKQDGGMVDINQFIIGNSKR